MQNSMVDRTSFSADAKCGNPAFNITTAIDSTILRKRGGTNLKLQSTQAFSIAFKAPSAVFPLFLQISP